MLLKLPGSVSDTVSMELGLNLTLGLVQRILFLMLSYPLGSCVLPQQGKENARKGSHMELNTKIFAPDLCQG